jgi:signal peptidase I
MRSLLAIIGMVIVCPIFLLLLLISTRLFIECRYLPSKTMQPTLTVDDRVLIDKTKTFLRRPYRRGEIIVFYPPPIEMGGTDLSWDPMQVLVRLTGLPFLPYEPAFIKRVVGLPGDRIRVVSGQGVFVNGQLLDESSYVKEPPNYSLSFLKDIGGPSMSGDVIRPYTRLGDAEAPIVIPPGKLFVLGDNRNNSSDSHVFGLLNEDRVIGRVMLKIYPDPRIIDLPTYSGPHM